MKTTKKNNPNHKQQPITNNDQTLLTDVLKFIFLNQNLFTYKENANNLRIPNNKYSNNQSTQTYP